MSKNKEVVIVIPVYKETPNKMEIRSLEQCAKILEQHPKTLICPEGLDVRKYQAIIPNLNIQYYPAKYFRGYNSYSQLCLSPFFYKDFDEYNFMLIYQPDCWVFRDELLEWCAKGYDYIGAPWLEKPPNVRKKKMILNLSSLVVGKVGNGGFSLRKIKTMQKAAKWGLRVFRFWPKNEDFYWAVIIPKFHRIHRPSVDEALNFAFELSPAKAYLRTNQQLPFGCHAWESYNLDFWKKFINV
ncbi:MAG: hypothetical protein MK212_09335 [Saprospiraceae bacterium]|nr:hypothetical protein [Saprospiraceae bacterium]